MTIITAANYAGFCSDGHILANLFNVFIFAILCSVETGSGQSKYPGQMDHFL